MSFKFKKELLFQEPGKDLHYRVLYSRLLLKADFKISTVVYVFIFQEKFEDNFFVKLNDELIRGNCQNGTFYETEDDDEFDVHFLVGFDNQCSKKSLIGNKFTQAIPIGKITEFKNSKFILAGDQRIKDMSILLYTKIIFTFQCVYDVSAVRNEQHDEL